MPHDGHFEQVQERIRRSASGEIRHYFGYSSVLDREAFDVWKHEHGYSGFVLPEGRPAVLNGYALDFNFLSRWWGGRVAGLVESPGSDVYGLLYAIRSEDWPIIQHKEGHVTGVSIEIPVRIGESEAIAFTTNPVRVSHEGPVSARYVDAWMKGARESGLPEPYIRSVATGK